MALKVSLKPGEQFIVNGAVIANGDRRTSLVIQNKVSLLRERDILQQNEAKTPAKLVYFAIMMAYLDPDNHQTYYDEFVLRMTEFMNAIENPTVLTHCVAISGDMMARNYYRGLTTCRKLFAYEEELLNYVPGQVSADANDLGVAAAD
ncbi:MAG: flagellar biosynthesis repressor FlbT [Pseudomonadota bacterium]